MAAFSIAQYFSAFVCGGFLCLIGQILIDKTKLTPARILVIYVVAGVFLGGAGLYKYLVAWGGAGATVPLTGFGYSLSKGVVAAIRSSGFWGVFTGGLSSAAGGVAVAIFFGFLISLLFETKAKS